MAKKFLHGMAIGFCVATVFSILLSLGLFTTWQGIASDKIFLGKDVRSDIVIIGIDNPSIEQIGHWPWDRKVIASALDNIEKGQPLAIGIDVAFLETQSTTSDDALTRAIAGNRNVTLAAEADGKEVLLPIAQLAQKASIGIANINPDQDGVARLAPLKASSTDGKTYNHFTVEILKNYFDKKGISFDPNSIPNENGYLRINYTGKPGSYTTYSFKDVIDGKIVAANFRDKIVLIGSTAPDLHDNQITPVSNGNPMNGVEIHANMLQTIIDGKYLSQETTGATIITIFAISLVLACALMYLPMVVGIITIVLTVIGYMIYSIVSFDQGIIRHLIVPVLAIIITGITDLVYKYFSEFRQKKFIKRALSYYLSGDVLNEILSDPKKLKLGGAREEISVLFSDIAGFTSISEKVEAEKLSQLLNGYLSRMTKIVFENRGVLDKYIGDAVMAFWGAPLKTKNHALFACKTALEMYQEMDEVRREWHEYGIENFDIRIGINTGEMVVGNMGSDARFDYTLIGDNVNLGSRLEGINKEYATNIIISEFTYSQVKDQVIARKLDKVAVKGKKTGVIIYELRSLGPIGTKEKAFLNEFEEARRLYEEGQFRKSQVLFKEFSQKYPNDNPTKVYIERLKMLVKEPPANWDGIFIATSK